MANFQKELRDYLAAGYAALQVTTHEEERAEAEIRAAAKGLDREMWVWELGEGWTVGSGNKKKMVDAKDPLTAIRKAVDDAPDGVVLVLRDYHPFIKVPENMRKIKSALNKFSAKKKTFLFLSAVPAIPIELDKAITVLEFTLPNREDLGSILDELADSAGEKIQASIRSEMVEAATGLTIREAEDAFSRARITAEAFNSGAVTCVQQQKSSTVKKSGLLEVWDQVEPPESLGGLTALKAYFARARMAFTPEAQAFGLDKLSGALLLGPPGSGKSLAAKVAASIFRWPLFRLDMGRVFGGLVGLSEERSRMVCTTLEAVAPAVVWIDELN